MPITMREAAAGSPSFLDAALFDAANFVVTFAAALAAAFAAASASSVSNDAAAALAALAATKSAAEPPLAGTAIPWIKRR
jgi:hypothetical protein